MGGPIGLLLVLVAGVAAVALAIVLVMYVIVPVLKAVGWAIAHIFRFIGGELSDLLRFIGAIITTLVFIPLVILNIIIGRWSASAHFGRAVQGELKAATACLYRVFVGHPARLLGLQSLTEGIEKRVPEAMAAAPGRDKPAKRSGQFEGYAIVGSLAGGGSGGRLYVAEPDELKRAALERAGHQDVRQVVIKTFSLHDGSSLPQIVRESRALDAAKKMGLVLEHELTDERFFYIMRYVPGESLGLVTQRLHAESGADGLGNRQLAEALTYASDLVRTLEAYHRGGLWHKDVKPDNIIVDGKRAHLVDLGLITPLRSAMTLTTHGTEYFRDPELVRLALKGVKVHQVDGQKFDIYAAGAVLYSVIENSFPAHGGLSQVSKRCPEALKWIVRRAMTDYDKRYASASEMLADLKVLMDAEDPFAVRPGALPSMTGERVELPEPEPVVAQAAHRAGGAHARAGASHADARRTPSRRRPSLRVADWWTGRYVVEDEPQAAPPFGAPMAGAPRTAGVRHASARRTPNAGHPLGLTAKEQVERARARAREARERAQKRVRSRHDARGEYSSNLNPGGMIAVFIFLAACVGLAALVISGAQKQPPRVAVSASVDDAHEAPDAPVPPSERAPLEGSLLVVKAGELSDDAVREVRAMLDSLAERGVRVFGALSDPLEDEAAEAEVVRRIAEADLARKMAPIGSEEAEQRVAAWLHDNAVADAVLWVHRGKDADHPAYWVVTGKNAQSPKRQRLLEAISSL